MIEAGYSTSVGGILDLHKTTTFYNAMTIVTTHSLILMHDDIPYLPRESKLVLTNLYIIQINTPYMFKRIIIITLTLNN